MRVGRGKSLWLKDYSIFPIFFQLAIREWFCRCCEWRMTDRPARKFSKLPGKLGLYSEEARQTTSRIPRNACTIGIRCDWRLLILRCHHGESVGNYVALERHVSRSHLESEPDSLQATRAAGTYCRDTIPVAWSGTHISRYRLVSAPPLGMEISSRDHRDTGRRRFPELRQRRVAARRNWSRHHRSTAAVPFASNC